MSLKQGAKHLLLASPRPAQRYADVVATFRKSSPTTSGSRRYSVVASTSNLDHDGDHVQQWDLSDYRRNPVVLLNHDSSQLPVARMLHPRVEGGQLVGTLEFAPRGVYARADEAAGLVEHGILRALSIGFRPADTPVRNAHGGHDYTARVLEVSLVPVGANADALVQGPVKTVKAAIPPNDGSDPTRDPTASACPHRGRGCPKRIGEACTMGESCPLKKGYQSRFSVAQLPDSIDQQGHVGSGNPKQQDRWASRHSWQEYQATQKREATARKWAAIEAGIRSTPPADRVSYRPGELPQRDTDAMPSSLKQLLFRPVGIPTDGIYDQP